MALLCNDCNIRGKRREIWCNHTDDLCVFVRYCGVSGKFYQTDGAAKCKMKGQKDEGQAEK